MVDHGNADQLVQDFQHTSRPEDSGAEAGIAGLEELDATFQKHQANLTKAKPFLDQAAPAFKAIMQSASYTGDQCPSAMQIAAMAAQDS